MANSNPLQIITNHLLCFLKTHTKKKLNIQQFRNSNIFITTPYSLSTHVQVRYLITVQHSQPATSESPRPQEQLTETHGRRQTGSQWPHNKSRSKRHARMTCSWLHIHVKKLLHNYVLCKQDLQNFGNTHRPDIKPYRSGDTMFGNIVCAYVSNASNLFMESMATEDALRITTAGLW